jgi:hypothetical protein
MTYTCLVYLVEKQMRRWPQDPPSRPEILDRSHLDAAAAGQGMR